MLLSKGDETVLAVGVRKSGVYLWADEGWIHLSEEDGIDLPVNGIVSWNERFYVATGNGLAVIAGTEVDTSIRARLRTPSSEFLGLAVEPADKNDTEPVLWLQGRHWLGTLVDGTLRLLYENQPLLSGFPSSVQPDGLGGVFYGNQDALFYMDRPGVTPKIVGQTNGLVSNGTTGFLLDREHNLWITNMRGVSKIYDWRFLNYRKEDGLLEDEVSAIARMADGTLILGHDTGMTFLDDNGHMRTRTLKRETTPNNRVNDLHQAPDGSVWAASAGFGVGRFNLEGNIIRWYGEADGLDLVPSSVLVDRDGRVWVGSYQNLYRLENGRFKPVTVEPDRSLSVRRVIHGSSGTIYLATVRRGLFAYKNGSWKRYTHPSDRAADNLYSVLEDRQGRVWVGAISGLHTVSGDSLVKADLNGDHLDRSVYSMLEDRTGRLLFGTDNGIILWDGSRQLQYGVRDGLVGSETNRSALLEDEQGHIWIGTNRGVSIFNTQFVRPEVPPMVELVSLEVSGEHRPLTASQSLAYDGNSPVFHFRAISFIDERKITYRYQLEGFDPDWLTTSQLSVPQVRYTNLPPGAYRFRLQAQNAAGVWSSVVSSAEIVVAQPFWRSWWAYGIYALMLAVGIMGSIRYHHRELERKHALQEREELTEARDAAEAANRAKSLFLANMSHEIRTPLNAILGYAQILQRNKELSPDVRGSIQTIESSGHHLLELINEVLDLSKIEAGRMERQEVDFDLRGLIGSVAEMFRMRCEQKGLAWILDTDRLPEGRLHVHGDEQKIRQILINLLGNAVKFTDDGEVMLRVGAKEEETGEASARPHYLFEVTDTGVGIAEEDRSKILNPFQQGSTGHTTEGTGLGLTIAHRMVDLLDGAIHFDSEIDKGSRFWFTLPLLPAEAEVILPADSEVTPIERLADGYTVSALVVDDVLENRKVLSRLLTSIGCEVRLATNGLEAVESVHHYRPDIILMDIRMPVMDGSEAARRIIQEHGLGTIKLVAVTASAFVHNRQQYLNAGFDMFLSKPFQAVEIYDCIADLLNIEYVYDAGEDSHTGLEPVNIPDDLLSRLKEAAEYGEVTALDAALDRLATLGEDERRLADHLRRLSENLEMGTIQDILGDMAQNRP